MPLGWQLLELAQPDYSTTKGLRYMHKALSIAKIIEPEAGPPFTRYNSLLQNALLQPSRKHKMNDPKATSVLQKLCKDSAREGQVSLVSTHDVTNPP